MKLLRPLPRPLARLLSALVLVAWVLQMGVLVPTKVERIALQNAASIASLLLTTDAVVSEIPEEKKKAKAGMGGAPGMM